MKIQIILCLFININLAFSQNSLSGKIIEQESKEGIIGASIYISELRIGASTDLLGNYAIKNLPKGLFTVQISSVSHKTILQKIKVEGVTNSDFSLSNSAVSLEEVVVTSAAIRSLVKESPIPITALSRKDWLQNTSSNLVDAIAKLPGISQIMTGPTLSKPVIRGLAFNRVITVHDGVRQEDNQWGEEHSLHIDEYAIDRYEIIKGAGSLMYGSDGLGGVIAVVSALPPADDKIKGNVLYNYQSNNMMKGFSADIGANKNGVLWSFRLSSKNANNYQNPSDGIVYGSNFREFDFSGIVGINRKWGFSRLYFSKFGQQINIIDGLRDVAGDFAKKINLNGLEKTIKVSDDELQNPSINPSNSQDLSNYKLALNNFINLGKNALMLNLSYAQNHRKEYGNVLKPFEPDLYFFLNTAFYDLRYNFSERKDFETTIGTNGMYQFLENRGNENLYPNYNLFDNGVFVFSKKTIKNLTMSAGLRHDFRKLTIEKLFIDAQGKFHSSPQTSGEERFAGFEKTYQNITGSLGAVLKVNDNLYLRGNLARGFRSPTVPEIASNGEHAGTFRYEIGNKEQKSEVSFQTDLGMTYENKSWYVDVNLFQNQIYNYSYSAKVSTQHGQDSLMNGVPVFRYQQDDARLMGLEGTVTFQPTSARWLSITQNYSSVFGQNLEATNDSAKYLPFLPPPKWQTTLRFSKATYKNFIKNAYFSIEFEHNQAQNQVFMAYNTETITPAYSLINLGTGASFVNKNKKTLFSLYFNVNNLFDVAYQSHQSRLKYLEINTKTGKLGVYNMGRNIGIKLLVPIN